MKFEIDNAPVESDIKEILDQLIRFNRDYLEIDKREPLAVWCKDDDGRKIGGITGVTFGKWLEIKYLWVEQAQRGSRIGTELLKKIESAGKTRGCRYILLDTFEFQAKPFYEKNGFENVLTIDEYPLAGKRHYLVKKC